MSGHPAEAVLRSYQVPEGSDTPTPVRPLPNQSPVTGFHPGAPYWKTPASGGPALFSLRRYQVAVDGSYTPMVVVPSPFQSPTTGSQPGAPYWNWPASGRPALFSLRRYQ